MTGKSNARKIYTEEFKRDAIRLAEERGNIAAVACRAFPCRDLCWDLSSRDLPCRGFSSQLPSWDKSCRDLSSRGESGGLTALGLV